MTFKPDISLTYPPYQFKLINNESSESLILPVDQPPIEWEQGQIEINRNLDIAGVFTSFAIDSLTFIGAGAKFIRDIYNEKEINGQCELVVSWWKNSIRDYVEMPSRFAIDFATIKPAVKIGRNSIGLNAKTVDSSELVKFKNRKGQKSDLTKTNERGRYVTMGGQELIPYSSLRKNINMPALFINVYSIWIDDANSVDKQIENDESNEIYTNFQMTLSASDYTNVNNVVYGTSFTNISSVGKFLENATEDANLNFIWSVTVEVTNRKGGIFAPKDVYRFKVQEIDSGGTVISETIIANFGRTTGIKQYTGNLTINISTGNSLRTFISTDATGGVSAKILSSRFSINYVIAGTDARTVESLPIYEAFERSLQNILDTQFPFYSEYLQRTDIEYNLNGDKYLSENQLRFANILTGLNLRGAALFDNENPLAISFDDLFKSANSIYNLGYELINLGDDFNRIRIENYDYFFSDVEILDLSSRLSIYDIETEVIPELAYFNFKTGCKDFEYEEVNGRGEYNTLHERTSVINTNTEFDNVSSVRFDTKGITDKLEQELTTTDSKEDNELFLIKTQKDSNEWKPEFQENITIDNNSSLFGDESMNLYFTPTRNLRRHGNKIKSALLKFTSSYIRFQTAGKSQTLQTTGEGYTVIENQDILVNELNDPIFKPIKHTFQVDFDWSDFETLMTNPKGYIKISSTISGYLLNLKKKNNENKATIELIEKV